MKPETRGRPRQIKHPATLSLKVEHRDKQHWHQCAVAQEKSLNQWMIEAAKKQAKKHQNTHHKAD